MGANDCPQRHHRQDPCVHASSECRMHASKQASKPAKQSRVSCFVIFPRGGRKGRRNVNDVNLIKQNFQKQIWLQQYAVFHIIVYLSYYSSCNCHSSSSGRKEILVKNSSIFITPRPHAVLRMVQLILHATCRSTDGIHSCLVQEKCACSVKTRPFHVPALQGYHFDGHENPPLRTVDTQILGRVVAHVQIIINTNFC